MHIPFTTIPGRSKNHTSCSGQPASCLCRDSETRRAAEVSVGSIAGNLAERAKARLEANMHYTSYDKPTRAVMSVPCPRGAAGSPGRATFTYQACACHIFL